MNPLDMFEAGAGIVEVFSGVAPSDEDLGINMLLWNRLLGIVWLDVNVKPV